MIKFLISLLITAGLLPNEPPSPANGDDPFELSALTYCYWGHLTEKNISELIEVAKKDSQEALVLSNYYALIAEDKKQSDEWLEFSAEQGNPKAQYSLSAEFLNLKEYDKGLFWLNKSAQAGLSESINLMAHIEDNNPAKLQPNYKDTKYWSIQSALSGKLYDLKLFLQSDDVTFIKGDEDHWLNLYNYLKNQKIGGEPKKPDDSNFNKLLEKHEQSKQRQIEIIKTYGESYSRFATSGCKERAHL